jgi:hypothetical protein
VSPRSIVEAKPATSPRPSTSEDRVMEGLLRRGHLSSAHQKPVRTPGVGATATGSATAQEDPAPPGSPPRLSRAIAFPRAPPAETTNTPASLPSRPAAAPGAAGIPVRAGDEADAGVLPACRLALLASRAELRAALVRRVCASLASPHGQLATTAAGLCHPFPSGSTQPSPLVTSLLTSKPCCLAVIASLASPTVTKHWNETIPKNARVVSRGLAALALRSGLASRDDIASAVRQAAASATAHESLGPLCEESKARLAKHTGTRTGRRRAAPSQQAGEAAASKVPSF